MVDSPPAKVSSDQAGPQSAFAVPRALPPIPCAWAFFLQASSDEKKTTPTRPRYHWEEWGLHGIQCQSLSSVSVGSPCSMVMFSGKPRAEPTRPWGGSQLVLPLHFHSPSQLLSSSTVWASLNQPGSKPWSLAVALATGRAAALCAKWTRSQHHVACHHARSSSSPLTGQGTRRPLNFPGAPHHWLVFLGSHSRPK